MAKPKVRKTDLYIGQMFGYLKVLGKVRTPPGANGGQRYRLECTAKGPNCVGKLTKPRYHLMREVPATHCGCMMKRADQELNYTKRSWQMMHLRCEDSRHVAYHRYGGRGITICSRWHRSTPDGFKNFVEDLGLRPHGLSLDRIDPDGHYEPIHRDTGKPQVRWASKKTQSRNQSRYKDRQWDDGDDDAD